MRILYMVDGYDVGIRYADQHVGQLLGELEALGVLDETAVIVSVRFRPDEI